MTQKIAIALLAGFATFTYIPTAEADLIWTGDFNGRFLFREDNWHDHAGLIPPPGTIDQNSVISANTESSIRNDRGFGTPDDFAGNFVIGNNALVVANDKTLAGDGAITGQSSSILIANRGHVRVSSIQNSSIILAGHSTLHVTESRDPLPVKAVNTMDSGSRVIFENESYRSFVNEYESRLMFNTAPLQPGVDRYKLEPGDNAMVSQKGDANGTALDSNGDVELVFSAIPEPGSFVLVLLCGTIIFPRRRRE